MDDLTEKMRPAMRKALRFAVKEILGMATNKCWEYEIGINEPVFPYEGKIGCSFFSPFVPGDLPMEGEMRAVYVSAEGTVSVTIRKIRVGDIYRALITLSFIKRDGLLRPHGIKPSKYRKTIRTIARMFGYDTEVRTWAYDASSGFSAWLEAKETGK